LSRVKHRGHDSATLNALALACGTALVLQSVQSPDSLFPASFAVKAARLLPMLAQMKRALNAARMDHA